MSGFFLPSLLVSSFSLSVALFPLDVFCFFGTVASSEPSFPSLSTHVLFCQLQSLGARGVLVNHIIESKELKLRC
jgi:hypothetical protein